MKISQFSGILASLVLFANTVSAADLESELRTLKEDVMVLQRQVYRGTEKENKAASAENAGVQVKIGEYDEAIRKINGRLDELEYKVKQSNDKVDKLNRDIEIRMKILEGRPIPANLSAPAPAIPTTYDAKVANKASRAVVGDKIQGNDLAPIDGEPQSIIPASMNEQTADVPPIPANTVNANKPEDMYNNAMQAYNNGFYDEAELAFGDILQQFPKHNLAGNAQYWLGEVYTKQGNLNKAKAAFKDGYEKYKNGNKAPDSLYRLGVTLENLKDKQKACIVFMSFADEFPKANADLNKKVKAEANKLGCKKWQDFLARHHIKEKVLAVGVSGGADSLALVLMAAEELTIYGYKIIALTVNHKLRPNSDAEAEYVAQIMQKHDIEHHILLWQGEKPQTGVEEAARLARYELMRSWCEENGVKILMVAHHLRDQAETFLMRLQRGSGLEGLSSIREVSEWCGLRILRPLLYVNPLLLQQYLVQKNISWKEDESNSDMHYLRNKVRCFLPVLEEELGISMQKIASAVQNLQSAENYIEEQVEQVWQKDIVKYARDVFCFEHKTYLNWHKEMKFRIISRLCMKKYIPRAEKILNTIKKMNTLPFSGQTLGGKEFFMAYGRIWCVPELNAKHKPTREQWKIFVTENPQYKNLKIPHKAKLAMLCSEGDNDL